jgi:hypothetical protein
VRRWREDSFSMLAEEASDESLDFLAQCSGASTATLWEVKLTANPA